MELNRAQYEKIQDCFPKQRKPAKISNLEVLNAVLYVVESGGKWRRLLKEYGDWHVVYVRVNRWAKKDVLQDAFVRLQQQGIIELAGVFWTVISGLSKMFSPFLYVENFWKLLRHKGYKPTSFLAPQSKVDKTCV